MLKLIRAVYVYRHLVGLYYVLGILFVCYFTISFFILTFMILWLSIYLYRPSYIF